MSLYYLQKFLYQLNRDEAGQERYGSDLAALLGDSDASIARAAAIALGAIRSPEAAKALAGAKPTAIVTDASLACAEEFLADGKKAEALATYKRLLKEDHPKHIKLAATRGMLACAGK